MGGVEGGTMVEIQVDGSEGGVMVEIGPGVGGSGGVGDC